MIRKRHRVPSDELFKDKRLFKTPYFSIRHAPNGLGINRFRVIVGKSVAMSAVRRHNIKRRCAHALLKLPNLGVDAVLTALPSLPQLPRHETEQYIEEAFRNISRQ